MAYQTETEKYAEESRAYLDQVHSAKSSGRFDKMITLRDPRAERFSQKAEDQRQLSAVDAANGRETGLALPESVDLGEGATTPLPDSIDLTEAKPERSRGTVQKALDFGKDLLTPRTTLDDLTSPEFLNNFAMGTTGGAAVGMLGGVGGGIAGAIAGALSAPLAFEGYKREIEKFTRLGYTPEEAAQKAAISSSVLGIASGLTGNIPQPTIRPSTHTTPPLPKIINTDELDALVRVRERSNVLGTSAETHAYPVDPLGGQSAYQAPTGNSIVMPSLEPGLHTQQGNADKYWRGSSFDPALEGQPGGGILRDAKGNKKTRPLNPATAQPGEYGTGDQLDLLGGYNVRGEANYLNRQYVLQPGEDMNLGMDVLRGQRTLFPEVPRLDPLSLEGSYALRFKADLDANRPVSKEHAIRYNPTRDRPVPKIPFSDYLLNAEEAQKLVTPAEVGAYPIQTRMSPSGKAASVGKLVDDSFVIPNEHTVDSTANGAVFPSLYSRVIRADLDAMKQIGPVGEGASALINTAYNNRAVGTSKDMGNVVTQLDHIFGTRGFLERKVKGFQQLMAGENPFIYGMSRQWNVTEAEQESLFNYMYSQRKIAPLNDRVRQAGETLFEHGLYPASSDPGVRMLTVKNPFTGKDIPLGEPGMFMPQQPINPITHKAINETQWGLLYERRGGEKLGITKDEFKKLVVKLSQHDPEVSSFKMKGLENMRLLDLDALGGSPYQWAKKLGYETDPFRATFRFNSLARLRGQFEQVKGPLKGLMDSIPVTDETDEARKWLSKSVDRALLNDGSYDMLENQTRFTRAMSRVTDVTMLQLGALGNFSQIIYPIARGGLSAGSKGLWSMLSGTDRKIIENSGSLFPAMLNDLTVPSGALARLDSAVFKMYGLSNVDRFTRYFAGHVGHEYIKGLEQSLLKNPSNKKVQGMIAELGGDVKGLLETGSLDENTRYKMIQQFANHTAGVTDVRGVPLYATTENPWFRLANKYKSFAQANTAEVDRLFRNAPTGVEGVKRIATLLAGAEVVGGGINTVRQGLQDAILGNEKNPSKTRAQWLAENAILGLGTVPGLLLVQFVNSPEGMVVGLTAGPAGAIAGGVAQDLSSTVHHGFGWRTIDTASKRLPLIGPVTGPLVQKEVRRETKREAARTRAMQDYDRED